MRICDGSVNASMKSNLGSDLMMMLRSEVESQLEQSFEFDM